MFSDLLSQINKECLLMYGYDLVTMQDLVEMYCIRCDILPDTYNWDYLVAYLWNNLSKDIKMDFDTKEEFEDFLISSFI